MLIYSSSLGLEWAACSESCGAAIRVFWRIAIGWQAYVGEEEAYDVCSGLYKGSCKQDSVHRCLCMGMGASLQGEKAGKLAVKLYVVCMGPSPSHPAPPAYPQDTEAVHVWGVARAVAAPRVRPEVLQGRTLSWYFCNGLGIKAVQINQPP